MSFVLFVLGVVAAAAGGLMIGFGIPINEFSLGNTLIIAGTTALAGGLIVIGLSVVARQVTKVADLLLNRPAAPVSTRSSEMPEHASAGGRVAPPRPAHPVEAPSSRMSGTSSGFDPVDDLPPLAPAPRPRIPGLGAPPPPAPPAPDTNAAPRGWRPPGTRQPAPADPVRHEPSIGAPERPQRPAQEPSFDSIWPSDRRAERMDPQHDAAPAPLPPAAAPRLNGDTPHRDGPPADPVPVSILKSGVVDGMAYTLYTDGSIEAELAQGVVRFGSIEELRNHLEKGA